MTLITGLIGIAMLATFLGIMLWWVKALPLIIIILFVFVLMIYDFVQTVRFGDDYGTRRDGR
jgi:ABC-type amino acid transport system permease subunit